MIADSQAGLRRRLSRTHFADHRALDQQFFARHVDCGDERHRDQQIHERSGEKDQKALPFRLRQKLPRIARLILFGRIAGHAHVAAEGDEGDAVIGVSTLESEQPLTEAE